jgi:putative endonuclease
MSYIIYALQSESHPWIYVGMTSDLKARLKRHNAGYERATKPYRPFKLIFSEETETRAEARKRERYWKSAAGKRKLKQKSKELGFDF